MPKTKDNISPYENINVHNGRAITEKLVKRHPLSPTIVDLCLKSWQSILNGKINAYPNMKIREMSISPQAMGALLHDVIPAYITKTFQDSEKEREKRKTLLAKPMITSRWNLKHRLKNQLLEIAVTQNRKQENQKPGTIRRSISRRLLRRIPV